MCILPVTASLCTKQAENDRSKGKKGASFAAVLSYAGSDRSRETGCFAFALSVTYAPIAAKNVTPAMTMYIGSSLFVEPNITTTPFAVIPTQVQPAAAVKRFLAALRGGTLPKAPK